MPEREAINTFTLTMVDIARLLRRRFEQRLVRIDTGLTVAEARALAFVWRNPNLRQTALAERMGVEPMTVVGYLDGLERAGYVTRTTDPSDRRAKLVNLTLEADPVVRQIAEVIFAVRADALVGIPEEQHALLTHMLETIRDNLCAPEPEE
ncbi:MarR family winged helix-turn-helix transcriptional regulator [Roseibium limicola]|uniref:MarR family transcriptional regulator n=1 Tax=Roseibium limicola TaxID=2816037 RepID=A0A939EPZ2_9HYPH|nr:MarR family transcriptional regulator [Roseibium limicola]MBO0346601.1 MarR family transcriptional regulator [Roseibium limicola]